MWEFTNNKMLAVRTEVVMQMRLTAIYVTCQHNQWSDLFRAGMIGLNIFNYIHHLNYSFKLKTSNLVDLSACAELTHFKKL